MSLDSEDLVSLQNGKLVSKANKSGLIHAMCEASVTQNNRSWQTQNALRTKSQQKLHASTVAAILR